MFVLVVAALVLIVGALVLIVGALVLIVGALVLVIDRTGGPSCAHVRPPAHTVTVRINRNRPPNM